MIKELRNRFDLAKHATNSESRSRELIAIMNQIVGAKNAVLHLSPSCNNTAETKLYIELNDLLDDVYHAGGL